MTSKIPKPKAIGWAAIRKKLIAEESAELIALIKKLYESSPLNKDLIRASYFAAEVDAELFEKFENKVVHQFFPSRGYGKLKLGEARKAIRDYQKLTSNIQGTAELMMTYVEQGVLFTNSYGDINEKFYESLESVLGDLCKLIQSEGRELYRQFQKRLDAVEKDTRGIGWGFHDCIMETLYELEQGFPNEESKD